MPVSVVCDTTASLNAALRESLGSGGSCSAAANARATSSSQDDKTNGSSSNVDDADTLHGKLVASAKRVLLSKIDYEEVTNYGQSVLDSLKSKYIVLKPSANSNSMENGRNSPATCTNNSGANGDSSAAVANGNAGSNSSALSNGGTPGKRPNNPNELPAPKRILYPRENVRIGWKANGRKWDVGVGMMNVGNTCYLNSTLQALFHVPAMANWLMSDTEHLKRCESADSGCIVCAMAKTLQASQTNQSAIRPYFVYSKLKSICKHLVMGRQEDAHEFLRYLVEAMEKSYLSRFRNFKELDQYSKETTPLNQILGGYLKSSVRCLACNHVSVTFQHFQDLLLDIRKADTVDEAMDGYFSRERLEDMGYKCEACKKKVSATKQFSLERAPIVLCIQLKRFSMLGTKLNKQITIKPRLDVTKFASRKSNGEQLTYRLVAMVTHLGASQHCGHYTAIGLTESGTYYNYDDSYVRPISMQNVCNTNGYIIFYEMETQPTRHVTSTQVSGAQSTPVSATPQSVKLNGHVLGAGGPQRIIGPQLPPGFNSTNSSLSSPLVNGSSSSKLTLNRNATSTPPSTSSPSNGSSKIMIHFKNSNASTTTPVKTSAATSSITSASATSTSSSSSFDVLKNSTTNHNNSNGLHMVGTGKFQESANSKSPLGGPSNKRQINNVKNNNDSSSGDDDDENKIVSSSTSSQIAKQQQASLPSMPKLGAESSTNLTTTAAATTTTPTTTKPLTNGFGKKSPAPIKSLVPYGSETDEEADAAASGTASTEQTKRVLLPNPLKRRQSSSSWSSASSSSDNDDDKDTKPTNGIKIKKAASSTTTTNAIGVVLKSPIKTADSLHYNGVGAAKKSSDAIDDIFNSIKRSNSVNSTTCHNANGISPIKKKSQTQQFTVTSTTPTTDSSSDSEDNNNPKLASSSTRPPFKRSNSTPPSPPVVKTNSGIWQVTSLRPVTACVSPTTSAPSSTSLTLTEKATPKNHKNPFAAKPLVSLDNPKRIKKDTANKLHIGNGYQRDTANESAVGELLKQSHRGYGTPVLTWNGQQSEIEKENFYLFDEKRIEDDDDDNNNNISKINNIDPDKQHLDGDKQNERLKQHHCDEQQLLLSNQNHLHNITYTDTINVENSKDNHENLLADLRSNIPISTNSILENQDQTAAQCSISASTSTTTTSTTLLMNVNSMNSNEYDSNVESDCFKDNCLQLDYDDDNDEMENIDSCSSATTATTVINAYCLSPSSSTSTPMSASSSSSSTTAAFLTSNVLQLSEDSMDNRL